MARFLFCPIASTGHVNPGLALAAELIRRGHNVRWYTSARFEQKVRSVGAGYVPFTKGVALEEGQIDEQLPGRTKLKGLAQMKFDMKAFIDMIPGQYLDLVEELTANPADVLVGDTASHACALAAERFHLPWAAYGISILVQSSRDTAPFGLGLPPAASAFGRLRNKALAMLVSQVLFAEPFAYYGQTVQRLGFDKPRYPMLEFSRGANLFLQGCGPSFEYPRSDMPENVRFIGALTPPAARNWVEPEWWRRLDSGVPVVLVTQGTIATNYDQLILPAIRALASEKVLVVVTTGSRPPHELGLSQLPDNVIVEQFVAYDRLMPKLSMLVTNGGYGTVQIALSHGIPMAVFAGSEEKPEVAQRVQWSGVGLGFRTKSPSEQQILVAVRHVLATPAFKQRALEMKQELSGYNAPQLGCDLLETLASQAMAARA